MKLYFKNRQGEERLIAECETVQEAHKEINKFLDEHNFKCYYTRSWGEDEGVTLDVGSHSEFFRIKGISHAEYINALQKNDETEEYHQITWDEYAETLQKCGE